MIHVFPLISRGKSCPRCGSRAERVPTPALLRPVRWLLPSTVRRRCVASCGWRGFARPIPGEHAVRRSMDADHEPAHQL